MAQKNETPVDSTVVTETKDGTTKPKDKPGMPSGQTQLSTRVITGTLSPELFELVTELRDTVKRIDPRKFTEKTLRRSLSNVSDILADIDKISQQD